MDLGSRIAMRLRDRRQAGRVSLHRPIRVRPASLKDGEYEEINETENASKRGIYFLTEVRRYFVGMRVCVTLPSPVGASTWDREYFGQVMRVEKIATDKRGVAVQFLTR